MKYNYTITFVPIGLTRPSRNKSTIIAEKSSGYIVCGACAQFHQCLGPCTFTLSICVVTMWLTISVVLRVEYLPVEGIVFLPLGYLGSVIMFSTLSVVGLYNENNRNSFVWFKFTHNTINTTMSCSTAVAGIKTIVVEKQQAVAWNP